MNKLKYALMAFLPVLAIGTVALSPVAPSVSADAAEQAKTGLTENASSAQSKSLFGSDSIASTIINTMLFLVSLLAVVMIIYSGIRYVTAHGDKSQVESAKNTLIYSVVGLIVAIVAYALVSWVLDTFSGSSSSDPEEEKTAYVIEKTML